MSNYFEGDEFSELNFPVEITGEVEFVECSFKNVDFSHIKINRYRFIDCTFNNCNFNNASVKGAIFRGPKFHNSKLLGIIWTEAQTLTMPEFTACLMDFSVFQKLNLKGAKFIECKLHEGDFYEAQCMKTQWNGSDLLGTNFSAANLGEADFRSAIQYTINVRETDVSKAKFSMPDAMNLLNPFNVIID